MHRKWTLISRESRKTTDLKKFEKNTKRESKKILNPRKSKKTHKSQDGKFVWTTNLKMKSQNHYKLKKTKSKKTLISRNLKKTLKEEKILNPRKSKKI